MTKTLVYLSPKGEVTLWQKHYIWHKWMPKTPANYAKAMSKITGKKEDGPCFWGMHSESPEEKGYKLIGELNLT